jgi:hypothetical protein
MVGAQGDELKIKTEKKKGGGYRYVNYLNMPKAHRA